jgi:DNA polymerase III gamma/tau subunit
MKGFAMTDRFVNKIISFLTGSAPELRETPIERLDWLGISRTLALYSSLEGEDREAFIEALKQIIEQGEESANVLADVVSIVTNLDISQAAPSIEVLERKPVSRQEPLQSAVHNFRAIREFRGQLARST